MAALLFIWFFGYAIGTYYAGRRFSSERDEPWATCLAIPIVGFIGLLVLGAMGHEHRYPSVPRLAIVELLGGPRMGFMSLLLVLFWSCCCCVMVRNHPNRMTPPWIVFSYIVSTLFLFAFVRGLVEIVSLFWNFVLES